MKSVRTIKLRVTGSTKLDSLCASWLTCLNWLSSIVFDTKEMNSNKLSKQYYSHLREKGLLSQLASSACRRVCSTYKTAKALNRWRLSTFRKPVIDIVWRRDFNMSTKGLTLWGEVLTIHDSRTLPTTGWKDSKIKKLGSNWYLILCYEIDIPEPKTTGGVVGVDMGIRRMLVATNSNNSKTFFFRGGELNHRRTCIRRARAKIQAVGTRSSRRLLKRLSGNEAAVTDVLLHIASKALVDYAQANGARKIVMEDLTNIRDSSLSKGKDLRSKVCRWPYAKALFCISYKAKTVGLETEVVSPKNTSRGCSVCGHVSASNRKGLNFTCVKCGHRDDADRNASINIRGRSISIEHNSVEMGSRATPESSEPPESRLKSSLGSRLKRQVTGVK
jgi:putative transposase